MQSQYQQNSNNVQTSIVYGTPKVKSDQNLIYKQQSQQYQSPHSYHTTHYTHENKQTTIGSAHTFNSPAASEWNTINKSYQSPSQQTQQYYINNNQNLRNSQTQRAKLQVNTTSLDFTPQQKTQTYSQLQQQKDDLQHTRYQSNISYQSPQQTTNGQYSRYQNSVQSNLPQYLSNDSHPYIKPYENIIQDKKQSSPAQILQEQQHDNKEIKDVIFVQPEYIENVNEHYFQLPQPLEHPERNVNECRMQQPYGSPGSNNRRLKMPEKIGQQQEREENIKKHSNNYSQQQPINYIVEDKKFQEQEEGEKKEYTINSGKLRILTPKGQCPKKITIFSPQNLERDEYYAQLWEKRKRDLIQEQRERLNKYQELREQQQQLDESL